MNIEIISHCWCPPDTDTYAQLLKWQMSSLLLNTPSHIQVRLVVCCDPEDVATLYTFRKMRKISEHKEVDFVLWPLSKDKLLKRSIGRNEVAKVSRADIVWFADCDYLFGKDCLKELSWQVKDHDTIYYPILQHINETHEFGTEMLNAHAEESLPEIDPSLFMPKPISRAIGGCQIVTGETARKGYLDGTKWTKPIGKDEDLYQCFRVTETTTTRDDVAYRHESGFTCQGIRLPNLYRIRHELPKLHKAVQ